MLQGTAARKHKVIAYGSTSKFVVENVWRVSGTPQILFKAKQSKAYPICVVKAKHDFCSSARVAKPKLFRHGVACKDKDIAASITRTW